MAGTSPSSSGRAGQQAGIGLEWLGNRLDAPKHDDIGEDADEQDEPRDQKRAGKGMGQADDEAGDDGRRDAHQVVGQVDDAADRGGAAARS